MNYPDSVEFLYALGNEIKTAKFGLHRTQAVLEALGRPQDRLRMVHVAGTNGKGSTCAMIESALRASGQCTGLFTSPHLSEPTERIRVGGAPVGTPQFTDAFNRVHRAAEELLAAGTIDFHTTYFETVTAMALLIFADEGVDTAVMEVGMGGRLDATNVIMPVLSVITPVDYDHEAYLGTAIESIAAEKAGILKAGVPAVFARQRPEAGLVLEQRAASLGIDIWRTEAWQVRELDLHPRGGRFLLFCGAGESAALPTGEHPAGSLAGDRQLQITCPLAGEHQVENAITAATALVRLGLSGAAIETGIARTIWPGRLERVSENPEIILDGAHNPAGARALAAYIDRFYAARRVRLIFGAMRDKAIDEVVGILFPRAAEVIVTAPAQARALAPEALRDIAGHPNLQVAATVREALHLVAGAPPDDVVFVTGSLYLVAEARKLLLL